MKIIIDAMGGDNAPLEIVKGALLGMEHWGVEVLLTGDTEAILRALRDCGHDTIPHGMEIVHTTETVDMCDDPSKVFRHKKDTSMGVGLTLLRDGKADALVSAGSTGALLAGATLITKRIRGIRRAAMAPVIPTTGGRAVLIDCGANAECTPEYLDLWARRKGIHLIGSGDFTHPAWREELKEKLKPAEDGFYVLKKEYRIQDGNTRDHMIPRFVITGEISSIYKKYDKVRKVHSLLILPGLKDAENLSEKLEVIGNLHSDGRPILGLDCRDLLEIMLETTPDGMYVPAHIWTPHFSMFGAFSGFDTVEECFGDLSSHIHAVETGLSSDPPMNWRVSMLDRFQLISNSDAHSPAKLGREATLLDIDWSYEGLRGAIQNGNGLAGTIEFFPEEGKYHMDGHRKCNLCLTPIETETYQGKCPVCGRKITIGVSHRIEQLADRAEGFVKEGANGFESLVPLPEVISACVGVSSRSKKVQKEYEQMLRMIGPEFEILRTVPLEEIRQKSGFLIAEGIERLRNGEVERIPGFDGEYGTIKLFQPYELEEVDRQR